MTMDMSIEYDYEYNYYLWYELTIEYHSPQLSVWLTINSIIL